MLTAHPHREWGKRIAHNKPQFSSTPIRWAARRERRPFRATLRPRGFLFANKKLVNSSRFRGGAIRSQKDLWQCRVQLEVEGQRARKEFLPIPPYFYHYSTITTIRFIQIDTISTLREIRLGWLQSRFLHFSAGLYHTTAFVHISWTFLIFCFWILFWIQNYVSTYSSLPSTSAFYSAAAL